MAIKKIKAVKCVVQTDKMINGECFIPFDEFLKLSMQRSHEIWLEKVESELTKLKQKLESELSKPKSEPQNK